VTNRRKSANRRLYTSMFDGMEGAVCPKFGSTVARKDEGREWQRLILHASNEKISRFRALITACWVFEYQNQGSARLQPVRNFAWHLILDANDLNSSGQKS
jgi:hypothetical protein